MSAYSFECLQTYGEFQLIRDDWVEFTQSFFPESYGRTHAWLSAYWTTYHHKRPALVYMQRRNLDRKIVAVAPLIIKKEQFGGFPIRCLQLLGAGIGTDDFLISLESQGFVDAVFEDLVNNHRWHVARFHRLHSIAFSEEVCQICAELACPVDCTETDDYCIEFPATYAEYFQSRSRKFRRNFNQASNRIEKEGKVTFEILNPIVDAQRVWTLGKAVSETSWQFQEGKSHFNNNGSDSFYVNLAKSGQEIGGEEFTAMLVDDTPVAYLLGCRRDRKYFAVDTAYHADYRHVSVGRLLFGRVIERLIAQREVDNFDFEGSGEYKDDYSNNAQKVSSITIYNRSFYARAIRLVRGLKIYSILKTKWSQRGV